MYYSPGGTDVGRGMGLCGWSEADQILLRLYDVPALLLCLRPALPHVVDLWSSASSGSTRRASDEEVPQLDGPQGSANGLVPGGGVMKEGWLIDATDQWVWRFHRDNSAWVRDPKVLIDRGRQMPAGPPLLKERRYLRKDAAEQMWKLFQTQGWKKTRPLWGATAEP